MFKQKTQKLNQKGSSQTILIIGIVLILAVGSIILLDVHRDRVMEEKIEELRQQVRPQQPDLLEQEPLVVPPLEPTPEEIAQWEQEMEEEMRFIEEFQPKTIVKLENAAGNKRTQTFRVEDARLAIRVNHFHIAIDDFLPANRSASYKISLYRVGEPNHVWTDQNRITQKQLEDFGWTPEKTRRIGNRSVAGVVGGIVNALPSANEIGEFYFEIEVKNVNRWFLEVEKIISPVGPGEIIPEIKIPQ